MNSFKIHRLSCVHVIYRQIMVFCHVKLRTLTRGGMSHDSRRDRVRFCVFQRLCNQKFVHVLKSLMKVMEDSRGRAKSSDIIVFPPPRGSLTGMSHDSRRDRVRFCVFRRLCNQEFAHVLKSLMEVMEDSRGRAISSAIIVFPPPTGSTGRGPRNQQALHSLAFPPPRDPDKVATAGP